MSFAREAPCFERARAEGEKTIFRCPYENRKENRVNEIRQITPEEYAVTIVISNDLGLHARPAAMVAQVAQKYASEVHFISSGQKANAKSILDILSLAAIKGTTLELHGKGKDAQHCVEEIAHLVRLQFMEESA